MVYAGHGMFVYIACDVYTHLVTSSRNLSATLPAPYVRPTPLALRDVTLADNRRDHISQGVRDNRPRTHPADNAWSNMLKSARKTAMVQDG